MKTSAATSFADLFLSNDLTSQQRYAETMQQASQAVIVHFAQLEKIYSGLSAEQLNQLFQSIDFCPESGQDLSSVIEQSAALVLKNSVAIHSSHSMAHLHCSGLLAALAAEQLISATNQSMDSWDQSPAASYLEQHLVNWLCRQFSLPISADGVFSSGGTQSNLMGLLLARDKFCDKFYQHCVAEHGLPVEAQKFRIFCSEHAHFSAHKAAALLGLGKKAIIPVACDERMVMQADSLERAILQAKQQEQIPLAIVATAGTTDFGSIDALESIGRCAKKHEVWLHVDAAVAGAFVLSYQFNSLLKGINSADSITVDFHKLFFQPISCAAFLVQDKANLQWLCHHADYLNPADDKKSLNLVDKSLQTSRSFDALKLFMSLQQVGRKRFAAMLDHLLALAQYSAKAIASHQAFELAIEPSLNMVVFRLHASDECNDAVRKNLFNHGEVNMAQTKLRGKRYLKFTLMNPLTTFSDIDDVLANILSQAELLKGNCNESC